MWSAQIDFLNFNIVILSEPGMVLPRHHPPAMVDEVKMEENTLPLENAALTDPESGY